MKKFFLCFVLVLSLFVVHAQQTILQCGKLIDPNLMPFI